MYDGNGRSRIVAPGVYGSHAKGGGGVARLLLRLQRSQESRVPILVNEPELECGAARRFDTRAGDRRCRQGIRSESKSDASLFRNVARHDNLDSAKMIHDRSSRVSATSVVQNGLLLLPAPTAHWQRYGRLTGTSSGCHLRQLRTHVA